MATLTVSSVNLRAGDDPEAGKLAETLHWLKFANERNGRLQILSATVGDVTLGDIRTDGYVAETMTNRVTISMPVSGRNGFWSRNDRFEAAGSDALLVKPGVRKSAKRANNAGSSRTLSAIVPMPANLSRAAARFPAVLNVSGAATARSLRGFLMYLFAELENSDSALRQTGMAAHIEALVRDMVEALCQVPLPLPVLDVRASARVRRASDYMYEHADDALTVQQIAQSVGVGPRSLQTAFREISGMSPRERLSEIRLENAHVRLSAPEAGATVTDVALRCGFTHLGRFAAAYRRRYGEAPSETLRRATF